MFHVKNMQNACGSVNSGLDLEALNGDAPAKKTGWCRLCRCESCVEKQEKEREKADKRDARKRKVDVEFQPRKKAKAKAE